MMWWPKLGAGSQLVVCVIVCSYVELEWPQEISKLQEDVGRVEILATRIQMLGTMNSIACCKTVFHLHLKEQVVQKK